MKNRLFAVLAALAFAGLPSAARADVHVQINHGKVEPLAIAISDFDVQDGGDSGLAQQMPEVITSDLGGSGLFAPVDRKAFIQDAASIAKDGARFDEWRAINAPALVTGTISRSSDGRTHVEFRLWDVFGQKQLIGTAYTTDPDNWRRIAHIISDEIYKRLTGEGAYFDSRIVYVAESGPTQARIKRLAIMDQDGANHHYLTDGNTLVLTPRFSPSQQTVAYLAYYNDKPRVYIYDLNTGEQHVLGDFANMTFSPRFSPDGRTVIMSLAKDGNSDIYTMDLNSRQVSRLTTNLAIDTAPCYSPDGRQIVFESDRSGEQQLYVMDAGGGDVHRITFGQGRYGEPVWSPRGDLIAFTRLYQNKFYIGIIHPDGTGEREITSGWDVESPTWAPNGRVLAYFKETPASGGQERARLFSIDLTGFNERELPSPGDGSDPTWSPLNQ